MNKKNAKAASVSDQAPPCRRESIQLVHFVGVSKNVAECFKGHANEKLNKKNVVMKCSASDARGKPAVRKSCGALSHSARWICYRGRDIKTIWSFKKKDVRRSRRKMGETFTLQFISRCSKPSKSHSCSWLYSTEAQFPHAEGVTGRVVIHTSAFKLEVSRNYTRVCARVRSRL